MTMKILGNGRLLLASLVFVPLLALAAQTVTVNGMRFRCQNECRVFTYPGGGIMVLDNLGGYAYQVNTHVK